MIPGLLEAILMLFLFVGLGLLLSAGYIAERPENSWLKWLIYSVLAFLDAMFIFFGGIFGLAGLVVGRENLTQIFTMPEAGLAQAGAEVLATGIPIFGWLTALAGILGLLLLWQPMRQAASRWLPIDPQRVVHTTALHYGLLAVVSSALTAVFLPALVRGGDSEALDRLGDGTLLSLFGQFGGFVLLAFLGVGIFVVRNGSASLERLGITRRFDVRWWLGATAIGLASAWLVQTGWEALAPDSLSEVNRISEALFRPLMQLGLLGAVLAGIVPAVSEELVFRGAAQPRFGLLLTALLFMVVHTQYTISPALGQILIVALLLGMVREKVNTTTAIAVHATYNFLLVLFGI